MKYLASLIIPLFLLLSGCTQRSETNNEDTPDVLNKKWVAAWNSHDSAAVVNMFDKNIVMNSGDPLNGIDSVKKWVGHYIPRIANLRTTRVDVVQNADMIVYSCTFQHDEIRKEAVAGISTGLCSFVYVKQRDNWKIRYIHMNEFQ